MGIKFADIRNAKYERSRREIQKSRSPRRSRSRNGYRERSRSQSRSRSRTRSKDRRIQNDEYYKEYDTYHDNKENQEIIDYEPVDDNENAKIESPIRKDFDEEDETKKKICDNEDVEVLDYGLNINIIVKNEECNDNEAETDDTMNKENDEIIDCDANQEHLKESEEREDQ